MSPNSPGIATPDFRLVLAGMRDKFLSVSAIARAALGRRGVAFASIAALVGLLCCLGALAELALSLRTADVMRERHKVREILDLEQKNRILMRGLVARTSGVQTMAGDTASLLQAWERVDGALGTLCAQPDGTTIDIAGISEICAAGAVVRKSLPGELAQFDSPAHIVSAEVMAQAIFLAARINDASAAEARESDALVGRMVQHYSLSLLVLALSTCGFVAAGLILIVLIGRSTVLFHAQWRDARQAQERLQETIEALPAGIVLYDAEERLVMFNSAAAEASPQLNQSNVIGKTYGEIAHDAAASFARMGAPPQGMPEDWIARFRSKGNVDIWQSANGQWHEWREVATRSGGTVGLRVDVTDLKEAKRHAEEAHALYESLVDSLTDMVYKVDFRRGTITFVSAAAAKFFGVPPATLIGKPFLNYVPRDDHEKIKDAVRAARYAPDAMQQVRFRLVASDGTVRHIEDRFRRSREQDDGIIFGVMRDVSESVALSGRLEEEMARLRSIVESSGAVIVLADRDLRILVVNREFEQLHGLEANAVVGRLLPDVLHTGLDPAIHARWCHGPIDRSQATPLRYTKQVTDPAGRRRVMSMTAVPIVEGDGWVHRIIFLGVDDTERLEAEQTLFRSERLVTVGEMAATVAHEIAQPLQVIDLARSAAQEEVAQANEAGTTLDGDYVAGRLERIGQQVERANRIVNDLRNFVRGHGPEDLMLFNPLMAVQGAINLTQHSFKQAGVVTSVVLADPLPPVRGHISRLEQVLVNLINNARDAGAKTIELHGEKRSAEDGCAVYLAVVDDGPGIPADVLPRLFREFVTTKPRGEGTGLGLRICRRIVEEMGGTIMATNRPTGGARFEILLPSAL